MNKNNHFGNTANTTISECANDTSFNKLAQLPTNVKKGLSPLQKRARSKWFSEQIITELRELEDSPLRDYYENASQCNHILTQNDTQLKARYCNTRVCNICNRVRTAKLMNGYIMQFIQFDRLEFTTLTTPNVKAEQLENEINFFIKITSNIIRVLREKRGIDISGIRKIEITYNADTDTYNPHVHILTNGYGNMIIEEWLKRSPTSYFGAQDTKQADAGSLNELFKYSTKFLSKSNKKSEVDLFVKPLDNIMTALYGKRTFQPFGKIKKLKENPEDFDNVMTLNSQEYEELKNTKHTSSYWIWNNENDWIELFSGDELTGYKKPNWKINKYK